MSSPIKQKMSIEIGRQGDSRVLDVIGAGPECQKLSSGIEEALGIVQEHTRETTASAYVPVDPLKLTIHEG